MRRIPNVLLGAAALLTAAVIGGEPGTAPVSAGGGQTCFVDVNAGGGMHDGTSWGTAFLDLQSGLEAANDGDQVWMANGTYRPTKPITADPRDVTFTLKDGVRIYGGFAGGETDLESRSPATNLAILSGDIGTAGVKTDNTYHVVTGSGVAASGVLDGVRITNGFADGAGDASKGAGIFINGGEPTLGALTITGNEAATGGGLAAIGGAAPAISNSTISANTSSSTGGGAIADASSPSLLQVSFIGNSAGVGGGLFVTSPFANVQGTDVIFQGNTAPGGGAGIFVSVGNVTLRRTSFVANTTASTGGAVQSGGTLTLENATFSGNSASTGGGLYSIGGTASITNATFTANSATAGMNGGAVHFGGGTVNLRNTILWGNTPLQVFSSGDLVSLAATVVEGGCPTDAVCTAPTLTTDPALGPLLDNGGYVATHALPPGSAAIDAGSNGLCAAVDARGLPRPVDGDGNGTATCDIGAFEYTPVPKVALTSATGSNLESSASVPLAVSLTTPSIEDVTVDFRVIGGSATSGADFSLPAGTLTIPALSSGASIVLSITNDAVDEPDETVQVTLSNPGGATLGSIVTRTQTIFDDDPPVCLGKPATIVGTSGADSLAGTAGNDCHRGAGRGGHDRWPRRQRPDLRWYRERHAPGRPRGRQDRRRGWQRHGPRRGRR